MITIRVTWFFALSPKQTVESNSVDVICVCKNIKLNCGLEGEVYARLSVP